jgi:predicted HAD superfamily Cof-like phosphohydrolase
MHTIERVREFHLAFGHPVETQITVPSAKTRLLRFKLLYEEVMEYGRAIGIEGLCFLPQKEFEADLKMTMGEFKIYLGHDVNSVEAADALADIDYVCAGANLCHGFPAEAVAIEVHRSNMSKLGADGKPMLAADGKVIKGPNYFSPNIQRVLTNAVINALDNNTEGSVVPEVVVSLSNSAIKVSPPTTIDELSERLTNEFRAIEAPPRGWIDVDPITGDPLTGPDTRRVFFRVYGARIRSRLDNPSSLGRVVEVLCAAVYNAVVSVAPYPGARMYWRRGPTFSYEDNGWFSLTLRVGFHNWGDISPSACDVPEGGTIPEIVEL